MKKIFTLILTFVMFGCLTLGVNAGYNLTYTAPFGTPTVDAEVDDIWNNAEWIDVDKACEGGLTDTVTRAKVLWDDSNLYFLAEVVDNNINAANDIFEVYIDETNCKAAAYEACDSHTRFLLVGGLAELGANRKADSKYEVKELGNNTYLLEGALPWATGTPKGGSEMGLEFMYNDGTDAADYVESFYWNTDQPGGDIAAWQTPSVFGTLILEEAPGMSIGIIIGIIAAVAVVAVAVVVIARKKKK